MTVKEAISRLSALNYSDDAGVLIGLSEKLLQSYRTQGLGDACVDESLEKAINIEIRIAGISETEHAEEIYDAARSYNGRMAKNRWLKDNNGSKKLIDGETATVILSMMKAAITLILVAAVLLVIRIPQVDSMIDELPGSYDVLLFVITSVAVSVIDIGGIWIINRINKKRLRREYKNSGFTLGELLEVKYQDKPFMRAFTGVNIQNNGIISKRGFFNRNTVINHYARNERRE